MSELLKLAEAYYTVAADLERNGRLQLQTAELLNRMADQICEQNIRKKPPAPAESEPGERNG